MLLVLVFHFGVMGLVVSELVITSAFAVILLRWFAPLIRPIFSRETLREVLRFGLPRVPHGLAQQVVGPTTDSVLLRTLLPGPGTLVAGAIGLYQVAAGLGLALKFFLSAFEYAWAPFYFQTMREKDAQRTFATIATYGLAVLVLLSAGLSAVARDVMRLMTAPAYHEAMDGHPADHGCRHAAGLVPADVDRDEHHETHAVLPAGRGCGGRGERRGERRPHSTIRHPGARLGERRSPTRCWPALPTSSPNASTPSATSAAGSPGSSLPGCPAWAVAVFLVPQFVHPLAGILASGMVVVLVFPAVLAATGFFRPHELDRLANLAGQLRAARRQRAQPLTAGATSDPGTAAAEDPNAAVFEEDR